MRLYYPGAIDIYGKLHGLKEPLPTLDWAYRQFEKWERDEHCLLVNMWIDEVDDSILAYHRQIKVTKSYQEVAN